MNAWLCPEPAMAPSTSRLVPPLTHQLSLLEFTFPECTWRPPGFVPMVPFHDSGPG